MGLNTSIVIFYKWYNLMIDDWPRKCLGWKTPFEVFARTTGKDYFLTPSDALIGLVRHNINIYFF